MATTEATSAEQLDGLRAGFSGSVLEPGTDGYDDCTARSQRPRRPASRVDRTLPERGRHRRRDQVCPRERPRGMRPRRRSQRRRSGSDRRRDHDRPVAHEGHPRRSRRAHGARAGRCDLARAESRDGRSRACRHRWRDLDHGHRRPHAGRRSRLADGEVRPRRRQRARGRARDRGRFDRRRHRRFGPGPVLGAARRRRKLRRRGLVRVPRSTRSTWSSAGSSPTRSTRRPTCSVSTGTPQPPRPTTSPSSPRSSMRPTARA